MERIVIETNEKIKQKLRIIAAREGRTMKEVITEAIERYIKSKQ